MIDLIATVIAAGAVVITGVQLPAGADQKVDRWVGETGIAAAAAEIDDCLTPRTRYREKRACIDRPYERCESQHGTMSQRDMNECIGYALGAWSARLDRQRARLRALAPRMDREFRHITRPGTPTLLDQLETSDAAWRAWTNVDCTFQAADSVGGSIHGFSVDSCQARHTGERALELEALADWWASRFGEE